VADPKLPPGWVFEREDDAPVQPQLPAGWTFEPEAESHGPKVSQLEAAASAAGQSAFGFGDEAGALLQGGLAAVTPGMDALETYREARRDNRQIDEAAQEQHPKTYWGTLIGTGLASGGAAGAGRGVAKGVAKKGLGALVKAGAKSGAKLGALGGLGAGKADLTKGEVFRAALEAAGGSAAGATLGAAIPVASKAVGSAWRGVVKPTPAAELLRKKGVDLTVGQMSPGNVLAQVEEAGQSSALFGRHLQGLRQKGREGWQNAVVNEARAPGGPRVLGETDVADQLAQAYEGYTPAYDAARGNPVRVDGLDQALRGAADDPAIYATPQDISAAQRFIGNEAGLIERAAPEVTQVEAPGARAGLRLVPSEPKAGGPPLGPLPDALRRQGGIEGTVVPDPTRLRPRVLGPLPQVRQAPPTGAATRAGRPAAVAAEAVRPTAGQPRMSGVVDADALLEARSNIRTEIARRMRSGDEAGAGLLRNAEKALSARLEAELPEDAAAALRAADSHYGRYKVVEDAVRSAGDQPGGFTPAQLSNAVRRGSASKGAYARGAGGPLRELAAAGRASLDTRSPPTGARLTGIPFAAVAAAANTGLGKRAVTGQLMPQRLAQTVEGWLEREGLSGALEAYLKTRAGTAIGGSY
jgi:hypothetical protein